MLFTFRRDDEGRETIEVGGLTIARFNGYPEEFEWLNSMPGITAEHVYEAAAKADEAGFWTQEAVPYPAPTRGRYFRWIENEVTVDVPVAETTSTTRSIDNSEDQA